MSRLPNTTSTPPAITARLRRSELPAESAPFVCHEAPHYRVSHMVMPGHTRSIVCHKPKEVSIMAISVSSNTLEAKIRARPGKIGLAIFAVVLLIGAVYALSNLVSDLEHAPRTSVTALVLLGVALFTALGFEFVNG